VLQQTVLRSPNMALRWLLVVAFAAGKARRCRKTQGGTADALAPAQRGWTELHGSAVLSLHI
jgi:hypothetical protein